MNNKKSTHDSIIDRGIPLLLFLTPFIIMLIMGISTLINGPDKDTANCVDPKNNPGWCQEQELNRQIDDEEYNRALYEYQECMEEASEYYVPKCYKPTPPRH